MAWEPPEPPDIHCPLCHQLVFRWHAPWDTLTAATLTDADYLNEAWNQTWLLVLGWRDVARNPFSLESHPSAYDLARGTRGPYQRISGSPSYGHRATTPMESMQVISRELARVLLAVDLRPHTLRTALQTALDPEPWPNHSLGGSDQDPEIQ